MVNKKLMRAFLTEIIEKDYDMDDLSVIVDAIRYCSMIKDNARKTKKDTENRYYERNVKFYNDKLAIAKSLMAGTLFKYHIQSVSFKDL